MKSEGQETAWKSRGSVDIESQERQASRIAGVPATSAVPLASFIALAGARRIAIAIDGSRIAKRERACGSLMMSSGVCCWLPPNVISTQSAKPAAPCWPAIAFSSSFASLSASTLL